MRYITELHNKHKDEPIWIAGSDPTLDEYPDNFFDDKIGMTVHLAYFKFPNTTYRYFNELDRIKHCLGKDPSILDKTNIFAYPFYCRKESEVAADTGKDVYFLKLKAFPPRGNRHDILNDVGVNAMIDQVDKAIGGKTIQFGGYWTCLHNAFYTAIMMGGNSINLIGSGHETIKGKDHFGELDGATKKMRPREPHFSEAGRNEHMKAGTNAIIEGCRRNGITVNWFKNYKETLND